MRFGRDRFAGEDGVEQGGRCRLPCGNGRKTHVSFGEQDRAKDRRFRRHVFRRATKRIIPLYDLDRWVFLVLSWVEFLFLERNPRRGTKM